MSRPLTRAKPRTYTDLQHTMSSASADGGQALPGAHVVASGGKRSAVPSVYLDRMHLSDLDQVATVEREAYSMPWPSSAYRHELRVNKNARYLVARLGEWPPHPLPHVEHPQRPFPLSLLPVPLLDRQPVPRDPVVGHGGLWKQEDEAHVTTIAVRSAYRGQGIGELLLVGLVDIAYAVQARWLTLEVRVSNVIAQNLYHKYGFHQSGVRPRYYSDNHEDAYVMWTDRLDSEAFRDLLALRRKELAERLGYADLPNWLADNKVTAQRR